MGIIFCGAHQSCIKEEEIHLSLYGLCDQVGGAKAIPRATEKVVVDFVHEDIFTRFGVPREIVTDQGTQFTSHLVQSLV